MKRILLALFVLSFFCVPAAALETKNLNSSTGFNASGSTALNIDIAFRSGSSIAIYDVWAMSDLSTSAVKIYRGATTGVTSNYTQIFQADLGDATTQFKGDHNRPLIKIPYGYQARVQITSTTANAAVVNWARE